MGGGSSTAVPLRCSNCANDAHYRVSEADKDNLSEGNNRFEPNNPDVILLSLNVIKK